MKIIIDTSSIIAMLLAQNKDNNMYRISQRLKRNEYKLVTCTEAFNELRTSIASSKFKQSPSYNSRRVSQYINYYKHNAEFYDISNIMVDTPIRDHTDTKFLKIALTSNADYLLTGDNDLLELGTIGNTTICKPREFVRQTAAR